MPEFIRESAECQHTVRFSGPWKKTGKTHAFWGSFPLFPTLQLSERGLNSSPIFSDNTVTPKLKEKKKKKEKVDEEGTEVE